MIPWPIWNTEIDQSLHSIRPKQAQIPRYDCPPIMPNQENLHVQQIHRSYIHYHPPHTHTHTREREKKRSNLSTPKEPPVVDPESQAEQRGRRQRETR